MSRTINSSSRELGTATMTTMNRATTLVSMSITMRRRFSYDVSNFSVRLSSNVTLAQQLDSGDLKTLDTLLPANSGERKTLADLIFSKLESGETGAVAQKPSHGQRSAH